MFARNEAPGYREFEESQDRANKAEAELHLLAMEFDTAIREGEHDAEFCEYAFNDAKENECLCQMIENLAYQLAEKKLSEH